MKNLIIIFMIMWLQQQGLAKRRDTRQGHRASHADRSYQFPPIDFERHRAEPLYLQPHDAIEPEHVHDTPPEQPPPMYQPEPQPIYQPEPQPEHQPAPQPGHQRQPIYQPEPQPEHQPAPHPEHHRQPEHQPAPPPEHQPEPEHQPAPQPSHQRQPEYQRAPQPEYQRAPQPEYRPPPQLWRPREPDHQAEPQPELQPAPEYSSETYYRPPEPAFFSSHREPHPPADFGRRGDRRPKMYQPPRVRPFENPASDGFPIEPNHPFFQDFFQPPLTYQPSLPVFRSPPVYQPPLVYQPAVPMFRNPPVYQSPPFVSQPAYFYQPEPERRPVPVPRGWDFAPRQPYYADRSRIPVPYVKRIEFFPHYPSVFESDARGSPSKMALYSDLEGDPDREGASREEDLYPRGPPAEAKRRPGSLLYYYEVPKYVPLANRTRTRVTNSNS